MLKAVVFDFDGLIMDTETWEYKVTQSIFQEYGASMSMETWAAFIGGDQEQFDMVGYLQNQTDKPIDREAFQKERRQRIFSALSEEGVLPGVMSVLQQARSQKLAIGLASSSPYKWVAHHLQQLNIQAYFDCIRTVDDVQQAKPAPDLYLQAIHCLGVQPEEAVALEDSVNGALAAKQAGLYCLVVPNPMTKHLDFSEAEVDEQLLTLESLDLAEFNQRMLA